MKVLVIGANGNTATRVIRLLAKSKHDPAAMIRNPSHRAKFDKLGVATVLADLEYPIDHAVQGCDAIIFAAGSGGKTGKDKTVLIDHIGAIRSIVAAQVHDVQGAHPVVGARHQGHQDLVPRGAGVPPRAHLARLGGLLGGTGMGLGPRDHVHQARAGDAPESGLRAPALRRADGGSGALLLRGPGALPPERVSPAVALEVDRAAPRGGAAGRALVLINAGTNYLAKDFRVSFCHSR